MTLHPSNLGTTTQNWIGRSQYADPYLNATVDDFQIYNSALTADEVADAGRRPRRAPATSPSYRFDEASGATAIDSSGNGRNATINSSGGERHDLLPGQGVPAEGPDDRQPRSAGRTSRTSRRSSTASRRTPPTTRRRCATTPTRREFPIMPVYTANQADKAAAVAFGNRRQQQLLQHQRHAAGPAVLQGAARLPVAVHHPGHVPQADRVAVAGTSTSTATTGSRTTTSSSSTGTRPPRRSAARASTTTCSARSTG